MNCLCSSEKSSLEVTQFKGRGFGSKNVNSQAYKKYFANALLDTARMPNATYIETFNSGKQYPHVCLIDQIREKLNVF